MIMQIMLRKAVVTSGWLFLSRRPGLLNVADGKHYEPLTLEERLKESEDVFTGLGCLLGEYHIVVDPAIKPVQNAP